MDEQSSRLRAKKVAVVVLNYKLKDLSLKCIASVLESDYQDIRIYSVDNNSQDGIEEELKEFKGVTFIQTGENLGYAGGNNVGIKRALGDNFELIFILNPDTTVKKDTIKTLVEKMEKFVASIASPKIYFSDTKKIWYAGGVFDTANVLGSHRGVDELDAGQYDQAIETDFATGAAMMVRREVFDKIGLLDERYFLYYEESDFCFQAKKEGFKIMYIPDTTVDHTNAASTTLGSPLQDYFITRNRMLFARKFLSLRTQFALLREALRNIKNPTRRLALFDFLLGKFKKGSFIHD